jgi:hypothetical protein
MTLNSMSLVYLPPHKFARPFFSYNRLLEIKNYEVGPASNGIMFIVSFVEIGFLVQNRNVGQTHSMMIS